MEFPGMELERGRIYCVIGANGSGKSTFARLLSGVIAADEPGKILEGGVSVGYLPQKCHAFRMSVRKNILLGCRDHARADGLMNDLGITHLADARASRLSGGECARMALARLMMKDFDLLILDEPTVAMDVEATAMAEAEMRRYVEKTNCALVLVTHSLRQARRLSDEVLFFHKGRLAEAGPGGKLLSEPERDETRQFLDFYGA